MEHKLTAKMKTLYSELFDDGYVEVFGKEYNTARALHNKGLIDLRKTMCMGKPMWEAKIIKAL
jgi:hypothetical protein